MKNCKTRARAAVKTQLKDQVAVEIKVGKMTIQGSLECHFKVQKMFVVMRRGSSSCWGCSADM